MEQAARPLFISVTPEELLGRPLNEIEQKFAASKLFLGSGKRIPPAGPRVAVVGSRKASSQGILLAQEIASFLAKKTVIVVSGLAEGIDTAAHETVIRKGGSTVAVLGTPLDKTYPIRNYELQKRIMHDYWAISQFPVGYPTEPKNFVIRNRTMALISDASIIVEAGETSGSLHHLPQTIGKDDYARGAYDLVYRRASANDQPHRCPRMRQSMIAMDRIHSFLMAMNRRVRRKMLARIQRTVIWFKNGSQIVALPNSPNLLRGFAANNVVCDEAAFFREDELVFYSVLFPMLQTTQGTLIAS